jgi:hypothetical protein
MKTFRSVCTLVVVCGVLGFLSATLAKADQISGSDPKINLGGDPPSSPAGIITSSFGILTPSGTSPATSPCVLMQGTLSTTSPDCFFENDITTSGSGETIYSLDLFAAGVAPGTVSCGFLSASPFSSCSVESLSSGTGSEVIFSGGSIPFHDNFTLDLVSFPTNFQLTAQASLTTVPESGTLAFLFVGMGVVALCGRKTWRRLFDLS